MMGLLLLPSLASAPHCKDAYNRNGHVELSKYQQKNDRGLNAYLEHLGTLLSSRLPTRNWLDNGVGFAGATLMALTENQAKAAIAINAQDNLTPIRDRDAKWMSRNIGYPGTVGVVSFAKLRATDVMDDPEWGGFKVNAMEIMLSAASTALSRLEAQKRFEYWVGFSEDLLPRTDKTFELITDVYGSYLYGARRQLLLSQYYKKQSMNGESLVIHRARDIDSGRIKEYGPEDVVIRRDGRRQKFEEFIEEKYPDVFSMEIANQGVEGAYARPSVIVMKRDPRVESLSEIAGLLIESVSFGDKKYSDIPSVVFKEP